MNTFEDFLAQVSDEHKKEVIQPVVLFDLYKRI